MLVGWIPTRKISSGPVDVKDLLNEGSLPMFGDRYSHLMHELQVTVWFVKVSGYSYYNFLHVCVDSCELVKAATCCCVVSDPLISVLQPGSLPLDLCIFSCVALYF